MDQSAPVTYWQKFEIRKHIIHDILIDGDLPITKQIYGYGFGETQLVFIILDHSYIKDKYL